LTPSFWTAPFRRPRPTIRYALAAVRASESRSGRFIPAAVRWLRHGGDPRWSLHPETWLALAAELDRLSPEGRFLELGSGLGGLLAARRGFKVTAVDDRVEDLDRFRRAAGSLPVEVVHAPLVDTERGPAYEFNRIPARSYAAVFVDGPAVGREGILTAGGLELLRRADVIVFDDADRPGESAVAAEAAARLGRRLFRVGPAAVIRVATPKS
jgi:hypothetical protein